MNQTNTLAEDVEIHGSISFLDNLTIEGKVEGEIISPGALTIGETAFIKGDIKTRSVVIWGKVEGNITVQERCEARASATIIGDISAGTFSAAEGATFLGRSRVGKTAPQANPNTASQRVLDSSKARDTAGSGCCEPVFETTEPATAGPHGAQSRPDQSRH